MYRSKSSISDEEIKPGPVLVFSRSKGKSIPGPTRPAKLALSAQPVYKPDEQEIVIALISGMLEEQSVYTITGRKGTGKSTVMLRLARAVALGERFAGHECEQSPVLWVAAENQKGTEASFIALCKFFGDKTLPDVFFTKEGMPFNAADIRDEATRLGARLIIIDSLQATFSGDDSNNNAQMMDLSRQLRICASGPTRPAVLAIAHPAKNAAKNQEPEPYGGNALSNAIDGNLAMTRDGGSVVLEPGFKVRGERFDPIKFANHFPRTGQDQFGKPIHRPVALTEAEYNEMIGVPDDIAAIVAETTDPRAEEVRKLHEQGMSQDKIAKQVRMRKSDVGRIIKGGL